MKINRVIQYIDSEKIGISAKDIEEFVKKLEENKLATHSLIMARGNKIFFEHYWEPFHSDFLHRMYSVSKSFVAIAVGFLEQDGLIGLDDPISKYFREELKNQPDQQMHDQTIRHMLMMSTVKPPQNWFESGTEDRVRHYFENDIPYSRPSGTLWEYDSSGSFVLGALVERLTGISFMDYLREKLFRKIGVSEKAYCLKCPGGYSWGDSAVLCRTMDLFLVARFMLNGGKWNEEQILNEEFVKAATTKQIDNNYLGVHDWNSQGYGYLFWMTYQNSFFFNGMGSQYAVCVPEKDLIMVINSDNQGKEEIHKIIIDSFFELIVNQAGEEALPENPKAQKHLKDYAETLKLLIQPGEKHSGWEEKIQGVTYYLNDNPMGIKKFSITIEDNRGCFAYTNGQGDKKLYFGLGFNVLGLFPQEGYSLDVGSKTAPGNYYNCAASAAWIQENKLQIMVQIVDRYFGNMTITLGFQEKTVGIFMHKNAEYFLEEYQGYGTGRIKE